MDTKKKIDKKRRREKRLAYIKGNWGNYAMLLPGMIMLIMFSYIPMYGLYMAFIDYNPLIPNLFKNENVGVYWFKVMFTEPDLWKLVVNTLRLNILKLIFRFPAPIILALLINEIGNKYFKKIFQSIAYLPAFISWVIVSGMMVIFLSTDNGVLNSILEQFGLGAISWYSAPEMWPGILVITSIWKEVGFGTVMFLAAITSIDKELYEAASIDGAGKFRQVIHITLPGLASTVTIMLILTIGKIFADDFEQIYTMVGQNAILGETTDVISTKVFALANSGAYRQFPLATAYGLVQGVISLILITISDKVAKKLGQEGIW